MSVGPVSALAPDPGHMLGPGRPDRPGKGWSAGVRSVLSRPLTGPLLVAGLAGAAAGYLALVDPHRSGHYPGCPILFLTGYWCPGCGGLRALHDLLHGELAAAVSANLVVVAMVPIVVMLWTRWVFIRSAAARAESRTVRRAPAWMLWSLLVIVMLFWGLRNLPATHWLAP
jgi:hypothetical protein